MREVDRRCGIYARWRVGHWLRERQQGVEPRLRLRRPAPLRPRTPHRPQRIDRHRRRQSGQRSDGGSGGKRQRQRAGRCDPDPGRMDPFDAAGGLGMTQARSGEGPAMRVDPLGRPGFEAEAAQFGRGIDQHGSWLR